MAPSRRLRLRPLGAIALVLLVPVALVACDSGGSKSRATSTTTRRRPHRTTTTSSSSSTSTVPTTATTVPTTLTVPPTTSPGAGTCGAQQSVITAAVLGGDLGPVPIGSYDVVNCRIAGSNPIWAAVGLNPKAGTGVTPLSVVLQRLGATWTVHAYGITRVGCDAPPPVPSELGLGC